MRGFDTFDTTKTIADIELEFRVSALAKERGAKYRRLHAKLSNCSSEQRCSSPACPVCILEDRKEFIRTAQELFDDSDELDFVTYIPYPLLSKTRTLKDINVAHIKDKLRCYLKNAKMTTLAIGCTEMDYDLESNTWVPHIHFITKKSQLT